MQENSVSAHYMRVLQKISPKRILSAIQLAVDCMLLPSLHYAFLILIFIFPYLKDIGLPSTTKYVAMWKSLILDLLSEIMNLS